MAAESLKKLTSLTPALAPQLGLLGSPPDPVGCFTMREARRPQLYAELVRAVLAAVLAQPVESPGCLTSCSPANIARATSPRWWGSSMWCRPLTNALTQQRLHHAYLFTGTRGVGKTTVSRILAKSLNCQGLDGQGASRRRRAGNARPAGDIDSGRFVDYTDWTPPPTGVDEVQGLLEQAVYKPVQGRFKVFMIDEVHMLTNTAFNAMLKTLEEPPDYLKFVLATTDPQKVPVTVLSRCLQFNLRPMAPETVREHLVQVLQAENVVAEPQALRLLARAACGSMRDALSLTDQAIAFGCGQIEEAAVRQMLGSVDRSYVFRLIDALVQGDGRAVIETVDVLRLTMACRRRPHWKTWRRAAAYGRAAGRSGERESRRCRRPGCRRNRATGGAAASRRDPVAVQHLPAWTRRTGAGPRRICSVDHGAVASAGVQARRQHPEKTLTQP